MGIILSVSVFSTFVVSFGEEIPIISKFSLLFRAMEIVI